MLAGVFHPLHFEFNPIEKVKLLIYKLLLCICVLHPCSPTCILCCFVGLFYSAVIACSYVFSSFFCFCLYRCDGKKQCIFRASDATFGYDPCPGTKKYVEVQYFCEKGIQTFFPLLLIVLSS